jgi:hypothetical protein
MQNLDESANTTHHDDDLTSAARVKRYTLILSSRGIGSGFPELHQPPSGLQLEIMSMKVTLWSEGRPQSPFETTTFSMELVDSSVQILRPMMANECAMFL